MDVRRTLEAVTVTTRKVKDKIMALKPDSAPGPDGISGQLLQGLADEISPALAAIFSKSLEDGELPENWRLANVAPIFKKGTRTKPENYRPVSLTSIPCKIMESIVRDGLMAHLEEQPDGPQSAWLHAREILCNQPARVFGVCNADCG